MLIRRFVLSIIFLLVYQLNFGQGCGTVADFSINSTPQCLSGNNFAFTNLSTTQDSTVVSNGVSISRELVIDSFNISGTHTGAYRSSWQFNTNSAGTDAGAGAASVTVGNATYGSGFANVTVPFSFNSQTVVDVSMAGGGVQWPTTRNTASNSYVEFPLTVTGGTLNINSITGNIRTRNGSGSFNVRAEYSLDGGATFTPTTAFKIPNNTVYTVENFSPAASIAVPSGTTARVRLYIWSGGTKTAVPITYLWDFGDGSTSTLTNPTRTYGAPGTYSVKLTATAAGCADDITRTVVVVNAPTATITPVNRSCNGVNDGQIALSAPIGGSGTYEYSINGGTSWISTAPHTGGYTFTGLGSGPFDVRVRDRASTSCASTLNAALTLTNPPVITATVTPVNVTGCNGSTNGRIDVSGTAGGGGTFSYSTDGVTWVGSGTTHSFTGLTAGSYTIRIRNAANTGCIVTYPVTLTQPTALSASFTRVNVTGCNGNNNGSITVTASAGGGGTYEYSRNGGTSWQSSNVFSSLTAGTYDIRMRDAASTGCSYTVNAAVTITQPTALSASFTRVNVTGCNGNNNGSITVTASAGGGGTYEYSRNGGTSWQSSNVFSSLTAGTYDIRMRDAASTGCTYTVNAAVAITQPTALSASFTKVDVTGCNGNNNGSITVTASAGGGGTYEYSRNGGTGWQSSNVFGSLTAGTYDIRMRDAANPTCTYTVNAAVTVTQPTALSAAFTKVDVTICNGNNNGSITVTGSAGGGGTYEYSRNGGTTWQSSNVFSSLTVGTYDMRMRDAANPTCTYTVNAAVAVTQPTALSASFTKVDVTACNGNNNGSITVTASAGGGGTYEYSRNGGATWQSSNVFGSLTAGTYDIRMRDAANPTCTYTVSPAPVVTQPIALSASHTVTNVTICNGNNNGSITVTASAGGGGTYEYSRNGGTSWQSSNVFNSLTAGTYDIRMRDAANPTCAYTVNAAVSITQPIALSGSFTKVNVTGCNGNNNGSITVTASAGGGGTYEYSRNGGTTWQSSNVFGSLTAGTYDIRTRDAANPTCTYTVNAAVAVTQPTALSGSFTKVDVTVCNGNNNGSITVTASAGGGGTYEYSRNGGTTWQSSNVFSSLTAGTYDLRMRDAANPSCTYTVNAAVTVTQPTALSGSFTKVDVTVCNGNNNGSVTVTASAGGGGTYEYSRNGGTTWQSSNVFSSLTAGTYDIRMRDAANPTCTYTVNAAVIVTQPTALSASFTKVDVTICNGNNNGSITVTASTGGSGTYGYSRNGGTTWQASNVFGSLTAGTYDIRMRDAANPTCIYTVNAAVVITQPAALSAGHTVTNVSGCNGNNNGSITVTASAGGGGTYEYSRNGGTSWQSSNVFSSLTAGTYDIRMRDAANPSCTYTVNAAVSITQPASLSAGHTLTNVTLCNGNNNGSITVTGSAGGGGTYEYSRNGGATWQSSNVFGSLTAGTYDIRMRDAANPTCTYTVNTSVALIQPTALSASFSKTDATGCAPNGTITVTASAGGSSTYEYSVNGGTTWQSSNVFTALSAGSYNVQIRDAANPTCIVTVNGAVVVTQPGSLGAGVSVTHVTGCFGNSNGSITVTGATGGGGSYEYTKNGGSTWQSSNTFSSLSAGSYDIRIRDAASPGCPYTVNAGVVITEPAILTASFTKTNVSGCTPNGSITVTASAGGSGSYEYSRNGGSTWQASNVFVSLAAGTYDIRIRDAVNLTCTQIVNAAVTITQPPALSASFTKSDVTVCNGNSNGSITVTSSAGGSGTYEYSSNGGGAWQASNIFASLAAGTYDIRMRDAANPTCTYTINAAVSLTQPAALSASFSQVNITDCNGSTNGSITVTSSAGGSGSYEYSKNGGTTWQASNVFSSLAAGAYDIRMRDAASTGCTFTAPTAIVISQPAALSASFSQVNITDCNGSTNGSITVTGSAGGSGSYEYSRNGGSTWQVSNVFNSLPAGTYNVQVRDAANPACRYTIDPSVVITQPSALGASVSPIGVTGCFGNSNGSITETGATGGSGSYGYTIDGGVTWQSSNVFPSLPAGVYDVKLRDAANPGCIFTVNSTVSVSQPPALAASYSQVNVTGCNGNNNGSITVVGASGGGGAYEYTADGGSTWQTSNIFAGLSAGTYNLQIRDASSPSCIYTVNAAVVMTQPAALSATFSKVNISDCNGSTNGSITVNAPAGGSGTYEYSKNGGTTWQSSNVFASLAASTYDIRMRDAANPACTYTINGTVTIIQPASLSGNYTSTQVTGCNGNSNGSITVTASAGGSGAYEYSINGGASWQASNVFASLAANTYSIRMRDAANPACTYTINAMVTIAQPTPLSAAFSQMNITDCNGSATGSITVTGAAGGGGTYEYSGNGGTAWQSSNVFNSLSSGSYHVLIRDAASPACVYTVNAAVSITQPAALSASLSQVDISDCNGSTNGSITVNASAGGSGAYEYSKNGGAAWQTSNIFGSLSAGNYDIRMRDAANPGCTYTVNPSVNITQPSALTAGHTVTNVSGCNGNNNGSITVTGSAGGSGAYEYSSNGGSTWQLSNLFGSLSAGTYDLRMRDAAHPACTFTINAAVNITQPAALSASQISTQVTGCYGNSNGSITVISETGGSGVYEYSKNGGTTWQASNVFGSLAAATYDIRMRDAASPACTFTMNPSVSITQPAVLNATHSKVNVTGCFGNANGSITVIGSTGGGGAYEYTNDGGSTWQFSNVFNSLSAASYHVQIRDAASPACVYTVSAAVVIPQPPALNASVSKVNISDCNGSSTGSITVTAAAGGSGTYEYSKNGGTAWQSSNGFSSLTAGTYDIRMRDAANPSCAYTVNSGVVITQPSALNAAYSQVNVNDCFGSSSASITINGVTGGSGAYEYTIDGGTLWQSSDVFAGLSAGTYNVQLRDANNTGCIFAVNSAVIITQPASLTATFTKSDATGCTGNGSITISGAAGGGGTFEYSNDGGASWQAANVFTNLSAGSYNVSIRDAVNTTCTHIINPAVVINQPGSLSGSVATTDVTGCYGNSNASITITGSAGGSGAYEYSIDGSTWQSSNLFSTLTAGSYNVQLRDVASPTCTYTINTAVIVTQPTALSAGVSKTNATGCTSDGSITVTSSSGGSGSYQYTIDGGLTWQPSGVFTNLSAGTYHVQLRDAASTACTFTVNPAVVITQPASLGGSVSSTDVTGCFGNSNAGIMVTGSAGGSGTYQYTIDGGLTWQASNVFINLSAGSYNVQLRDAASPACTFVVNAAVAITQPIPLSAGASQVNVSDCNGSATGTITVTGSAGGSGAYEYSANGGSTWQPSNLFGSLAAGTYAVQMRDAANTGCIFTALSPITISQPAALSASLSKSDATGCTPNGIITVTSSSGGSGTYEYTINGGGSWQTSNLFGALAGGTYNVQIRDAGSPACVVTVNSSVVITQPGPLGGGISASQVTGCNGNSNGSIAVTGATGGSGSYEYSNNGGSSWQTSNIFTALQAGTYAVQLRDAASIMCTYTINAAVAVNQPAALSAAHSVSSVTTCNGNNNGSITITGSAGGSGTYEYSSNGGTSWQSSNIFGSLFAGTYDIRMRDAANPTCTYLVDAAAAITQPVALSASHTATDASVCYGNNNGSITVNGSAGGSGTYEYTVDAGANWQASNLFNSLAAGSYHVQVRDAANPICTYTVSPSVVVNQPPLLSASSTKTDVTACNGNNNGSITVTGSAGGSGTYEYSNNSGTSWQPSNVFGSLTAGTYDIRMRDAVNPSCSYVINAAVTLTQPLSLSASVIKSDATGCTANGSIMVTSSAGGSGTYEYSIDGGSLWQSSNVFISLSAGSYHVQIRDAASTGCVFTANSSVIITQPGPLGGSASFLPVTGCNGNSNGSISLNGSTGGSGNYEYTIDGSAWQSSNAFTNLPAGTYSAQIRDAVSPACTFTASSSVIINQPAPMFATSSHNHITDCNGSSTGSITVTGSTGGSGTYEYSKDGGIVWQAANVFNTLTAGTYNIRMRDAAQISCIYTVDAALVVSQPAALSAGFTSTSATGCTPDGSITVTASAGGNGSYEYTINGGGFWQSSNVFGSLAAGTYNVQIRDAASPSCVATVNSAVNITQPGSLGGSVSSIGVTGCNGNSNGSITVTGSTGGSGSFEYTINGSTWQASNVFNALAAGTYDIQLRDATSPACTFTINSAILITEPAALFATSSPNNITDCYGNSSGSITVTGSAGGSGNYEYRLNSDSWQPSNVFSGLTAGSYSLQLRDAANPSCTFLVDPSLAISQPVALSASVDSINSNCFGSNNGAITISAPAGGSGFYKYSINNGSTFSANGNFTSLSPGVYQVVLQDSMNQNCRVSLNNNLRLTEPAQLNAIVDSINSTCNGINDASISVSSPTGGSGFYKHSINNGTTYFSTGSFSSLSAGAYQVVIQDSMQQNCFVTLNNSLVLSQPAVLNAVLDSSNATCFGVNDGVINISLPTGGSGLYKYSIDGGTTYSSTGNFFFLSPGAYQVMIRDSIHNGCSISLNSNLELSQPLVLSALVDSSNATCSGINNASISITSIAGGSGRYKYSIDGGNTYSANPDFTALFPGAYQVVLQDSIHKGCTRTLNGNLVLNQPGSLAAMVDTINPSCNGTSDATIIIGSSTGGSGRYKYSIDGGTTFSVSGTFDSLPAGSYQIVIQDSIYKGCSRTLVNNFEIVPTPVLSAMISSTNINCYGARNGEIVLSAPTGGSGLYKYSIDGGASFSRSGAFSALAPAFYQVVIQDSLRKTCKVVLNNNLQLTQNSVLSATLDSSNTTCNGASDASIAITLAMGGSGFYKYSIDGGGTYVATGTFNALAPGTYQVILQDSLNKGCTINLNDNLRISAPALLSATIDSANINCFGASNGEIIFTSATGGSGLYKYSIHNGASYTANSSFTNLAPGTYQVMVQDSLNKNCLTTVNSNMILREPARLFANVLTQDVSTCFGDSNGIITLANATGGSGNYEFALNNTWGAATTYNDLALGTYKVDIRDKNNPSCTVLVDGAIRISQPAKLEAQVSSVNPTGCSGSNNGAINVTQARGGNGTYQYSNNGGRSWISNGTAHNFTSLSTGTYQVRIRDAQHTTCEIILDTVLLIHPNPAQPTAINTQPVASGPVCEGSASDAFNIIATGTDLKYSWRANGNPLSDGDIYSGTGSSNLLIKNASINLNGVVYDVVVTGACGNLESDKVSLTVTPQTQAGVLSVAQPMCIGAAAAPISLTGYNGQIAGWEKSEAPFTSWTRIPFSGDTYYPGALLGTTRFRALVQNGQCQQLPSTETVLQVQPMPSQAVAGPDQVVCENSVTMAASIPVSGIGRWILVTGSDGEFEDQSDRHTKFTGVPGTGYLVVWQVTNSVCPASTDTVRINLGEKVTAQVNADQSIEQGEQAQLEAGGGSTYDWHEDATLSNNKIYNPVASPQKNTIYTVIVSNAAGCMDSASVTVFVQEFFIPNTFSPNDDGNHDNWRIQSIGKYKQASMHIYNRWGQTVGMIDSPEAFIQGWDGKSNGAELPVGTYFYILKLGEEEAAMNGSVTILR